MLKTIGVLVIIGLLVGAWGVHRGWFTIDRADAPGVSRVTFGLDKDKLKRDTGTARTSFDDAMASLKVKIAELKDHSKTAVGEQKVALDRQIVEFEGKRDAIARKLDRLADATAAELVELKREIKDALDDVGAALDRALASLKAK